MSDNSELVWVLVILAIVGFLWGIFAPECYGKSFAIPSIYGAAVVGYIGGRKEARKTKDGSGEMALTFGGFIHGWLGVIFAVPAIGIGWFLGIVVCFNILPEFGYFHCVTCVEAAK
ncbi:MAG: hypothetical protein JKY31_03695 [Rhodobacteraceae bacterium]|nr:hypothetical protein [Paracoccaceae bacterium]